MKKNFLLLFTFLILAALTTGCGNNTSGNLGKDGGALVGNWTGIGNALGKDSHYNCDYLNLSIDQKGQNHSENIVAESCKKCPDNRPSKN